MTLSCVAPRCAIPRRHIPGCDGECPGCLPALAMLGRLCQRCLDRAAVTLTEIADMYARLPLVLIPGSSGGQKVSGTPSPPAPLNLDAFDLYAEARLGSVHDDNHDQVGQPSAAAILETWVRDWSEQLRDRPGPTVPDMVRWLKANLDWAARHHDAVDEFIAETRTLHARLVQVLGEREPQPEHCPTPCRSCDERNLYRRPDGSGDVDCHTCGLIYRRTDYDRWTALVAASAKRLMAPA